MTNDNQHIPAGYKPSPLGPIPEDWEVKRLGDFSRFFSGGTPKSGNPLFYNGGIPFIRSGEINKDKTELFLSQDGVDNSSAKLVEKGDILYALYGANSGQCSLSKIQGAINQAILCIRPNANKYYVMSVLQLYKEHYYNSFLQGGQGNLSGEIVSNYRIAIPPIEEQVRICNVLQLWDTAIAKQTQLVEKLTLRKRGLMQQLLTGKKRLKGFEGQWKRIKAGEIFKSISVKGNGSEVLLSATQEHGVIPRDQLEGRVTMPTGDTNSFKLVEVGDFVISLRSFQGGLEYSEHRGIVSPAYTVLKPIVEIDKPFYRYYFKSAEFIGHLAIAVIGIRDGKQISYEDFCFVKIPYPNIKEQKAISTVLLQADKEIEIQKQKLAAMQEQKKGLMQVLLTGKKRTSTN